MIKQLGMGRIGAIAGLVAVALVAWIVLGAHRAGAKLKEQTEEQAIITVATVKPQPPTEGSVLSLPGNVQANYEASIYARTSGYLKRWLVDIGTPVKTGQVLAEIDAPELDQQLHQAQADLGEAEANRNLAKLTADRWRGLRDTGAVSNQAVDEKIGMAAAGDAQLQSARANLQRLRDLSSFKKIVAPFDGVITARNTDVGQLITAGGSGLELFRIADMRQLRLYVRVPQAYAAVMKPDLGAEVRFPDRPTSVYQAKLERTSGAIDATSRTLLAQLIVDNSKNELLPGSYAEVRFALPANTGGGSLKLPANVLLSRGDGLSVATVGAQGKVTMKPVTIGRDYGTEIEVVTGLNATDDVIVSPPDSLTEGQRVRIAQSAAKRADHS